MVRFEWEEGVIVPIQIREDLWIRIGRVPHDLTRAEAEKISRVILALAEPAIAAMGEGDVR